MEQYPGGPREEKPNTAWRFVVGCGAVVLVVLIAGGVACGLVCRHLTARTTVAKDKAVMTGQETGHAWLYVTESDPGMVAIRRHIEKGFERMAEQASRPGAKARLEGGMIFLPLRLQVRTYPPASADGARVMVGEVELSGGYNIFRGLLRFMGRERRDALENGASLYRFPKDEGDFSLGVAGNRFVASRARDAVVPLVDGSHAPLPLTPPPAMARMVDAVRLPTEDAAVWATGSADPSLAWMHFGALSADLVSDDKVDFRAAFDVPEGAPKEESANRVEDWLRQRVPEGLTVSLGEPEWLDASTVRYTGTVTGLAAYLDSVVKHAEDEP